ncbi:HAAS signaling domain-containing protein [Streptomyces exfoliatus]|uniref:HAAS signaling domain-containing protein n=1 Tax=Streptomyces exfoliatus TaxID=1905 RepID=UPI00068C60F9|nr:hypothetical protein [Streptomyces exfoliatus]
MNAIDHPLVTAYLDAVARETAELPAERRAELLADLREHVEASDARDDDQVREVLTGLGEPRTVAASALSEETPAGHIHPAPVAPGRAKLTVILLGCSGPLLLASSVVGTIALIAGLALLWGAPRWETRHKVIGTATAVAVPVLVFVGALLGAASRIGPIELLLLLAFSLGVPAVGATVLLRAVRR